ncbi:glycoside hydrolase family 32 protein [Psittacicella hinzii]|uniref:Sucrose-6-phosphate hydrolase n=1 Tax=Psittacicella hinzii TaxID=2028575 RepID=A0A3A1YR93_9GAMM|nr:sucrose-6-phosphate hydrolase [Psittacicella hinzii]RIY40006.1 hypothetical protein CKF58_01185 [Psittacicella hinzii]
MNKQEYLDKYHTSEQQAVRQNVANDPYRLQFHIQPESGWMNDPNGLSVLNGTIHWFYQYNPFNPKGGAIFWGHVSTKDYVNFTHHAPALYNDHPADRDGVYSGSAYIENGTAYYFYTGNVKHRDQEYDYITAGREQNTILVTSKDGVTFSEKEVVLCNADYPADMSNHVRDPKVWKQDGRYYMVLGARTLESKGMVLIYVSDDLHNWSYHMRLDVNGTCGYMMECPDLFNLDGQWFLISCPQGIEAKGYEYNNVYQCGYHTLDIDLQAKTYRFTSDFIEIDRGFDFYAVQTYVDDSNRRILVGWFGLPDITYTNPTLAQGWQHCLSVPRELKNVNGRLHLCPINELQALRQTPATQAVVTDEQLRAGINTKVYELDVVPAAGDITLALRRDVTLSYNAQTQVATLTMGKSGYGRDVRHVKLAQALSRIHVYSDTSTLEIFLNDGAEVFNTRVYAEPADEVVSLVQGSTTKAELYALGSLKVTNLAGQA